ncbi:MAG: DUF1553 domain-containing protein [Spirosomataceae bacterium]
MKKTLSKLTLITTYFFYSCSGGVEIPENIAALEDKLPETIDYNTHVKPLLSDRCFKCHGPDKNKVEGNLQLTNAEAAYSKGKSGKIAIEPGDVDGSELVKRILSNDPDELMPTPKSHLSLSDEDKAVLIKWISQGAEYKEHWAFEAPKKPDVPKIGTFFSRLGWTEHPETNWVSNEIDNFVIDKLKEKNLNFSPIADKATLLRRVSLDLTGLPPTAEEVDAFLNDKSPNAYEKAVDKLLKSPHFGENMATSWLDLARYADTHGYQDDGFRDMYPYRDWVIRQFNQNLTFDKFVTWQIAGDLIEKPTRESILGTAFNRNHQQSQEGGIVPKEYHVEYIADRVNTFGKAFLGLTTECARCHDHKYDPISAKDYYSLFAFFNTNNEYGQIPYNGEPSPTILLTDEEAECDVKFINEQLKPLNQKLDSKNYQLGFNQWLNKVRSDEKLTAWDKKGLIGYWSFDKPEKGGKYKNAVNEKIFAYIGEKKKPDDVTPVEIEGKVGKGLDLVGDSQITLEDKFAKFERNQPFSIALWVKNKDFEKDKYLFCNTPGPMDGFRGYQAILNTNGKLRIILANVWPDNAIEIEAKESLPLNQWTHIAITYDGLSKASGLKIYYNGRPLQVTVVNDGLNRSMLYGKEKRNWGGSNFNIGRMSDQSYKNYAVDELAIFKKELNPLEINSLYKNTDEIKATLLSDANINGQRQNLLKYYIQNHDSTYVKVFREKQKLIANENEILSNALAVMVMKETPASRARKSYLLKRGAYDAPDKEIKPEFMSKFGAFNEKYPKNRLGLAQWLLDEKNPLFARVMVNRFWIQFFGNGLVKTQEDFGNQGDMPSHPELLDWLAIQFREDGWDTKKFIKRIVMSSTYRQSSVANPKLLETDPDNKWLARGPSYRLSAEQIRDNALAASGLLNPKIGGKYVYPYQPSGIWEALATRNGTTYIQSLGDSIYRRSLYTIWKRSSPPPMMLNFDVPDRSFCSVRRQKTSTPLQALVTLNDPQFVEAARVLSEKIVSKFKVQNPNELNLAINYAFKAIISRPPRMRELNLMTKLYQEQLADYQQNPKEAEEVLKVGEFRSKIENADNLQIAAMTIVCNTIMNYDEAVVKR